MFLILFLLWFFVCLFVWGGRGKPFFNGGQDLKKSSVLTTLYRQMPIISQFHSKLGWGQNGGGGGKTNFRGNAPSCPPLVSPLFAALHRTTRTTEVQFCLWIYQQVCCDNHQLLSKVKRYLQKIKFQPVNNIFLLYPFLKCLIYCWRR